MSYRELLPAPALRPFVDRFWVQTGEGDREAAHRAAGRGAHRVLPDGCLDVILRVAPGAPGGRGEVGSIFPIHSLLAPAHCEA